MISWNFTEVCAFLLSCFSCFPFFVTLWTVALPGFSVYGILQTRILGWVAMPSSRGSSRLRDPTWVSCIDDKFFTAKPLGKPLLRYSDFWIIPHSGCMLKLLRNFFFFFLNTDSWKPQITYDRLSESGTSMVMSTSSQF